MQLIYSSKWSAFDNAENEQIYSSFWLKLFPHEPVDINNHNNKESKIRSFAHLSFSYKCFLFAKSSFLNWMEDDGLSIILKDFFQ